MKTAAPAREGVRVEILEPYFESHIHKYNWIRRHFVAQRNQKHKAQLCYQPESLKYVCRTYPVGVLINAVADALRERRRNYFSAFMEILGEEIKPGEWESKSA